ncbi:MAG: methionyl-tRNA formyltransferase [Pyrinomonadaceae bacterium]|nr:methionyl-tRNA formyltransferase [Pyrinomonadaceae bacterium]
MKIVFMGTPLAAVPTLEQILEDGHEVIAVWTQPDRPSGRGNRLTAPPVKEFAVENDLKVFQPSKIKTKESLELFRSHNADVAVVVAYGRILPKTFLEAFPKGAINVHFSLLPKYRGAAPVNWAIVNGETKTGITTMKMDEGLDTGDILLQSETEIGEDENAIDLMARLSFEGARLLSETLKKLDEIEPRQQSEINASYAPMLVKEEGKIDWSANAETINNHIRGFQPFPTSFTFYQGKKLTIWKAQVWKAESGEIDNNFGKILDANKQDLFVNCGEGTVLRIEELQIQGKNRMKTVDFLNGVKMHVGEILGNEIELK